jgi:hypothetical protein
MRPNLAQRRHGIHHSKILQRIAWVALVADAAAHGLDHHVLAGNEVADAVLIEKIASDNLEVWVAELDFLRVTGNGRQLMTPRERLVDDLRADLAGRPVAVARRPMRK